jgi:predicted CXXCH cytochrome family protein
MKTPLKRTVSRLAAVSVLSAAVVGIFGGQPAVAGIADTKHNLGSGTTTGNNSFTKTGEICVFCHTPHAADTAAQAPLWNRVATASPTYATYSSLGTLSLDGGSLAIGSTSAACLSCHDGTQAMNTVGNAPGSGTAATGDWLAGLSGTGWTGTRQTSGKMTGLAAVAADADGLKNDHPVSIQYAGGPKIAANIPSAGTDYTKSNFNDEDFKPAKSVAMNNKQVWWVESDSDGVRTKKDLPLYSRTGTLTYADTSKSGSVAADKPQPFVECASCHDPHQSENPTFLRVKNDNSAVCLACHDK